ncbi:IS5 family transposase (plasmid) [Sulfitobacter sp. W027]|uniref:IS5 family transposase n=1 Tax=Sulfitobacter sp. W027 TaxID=2867025 RepID=UPI0021A87751|nr:IS5 family transposase [Sulfitobacter sp. W027]UWR35749.1 IS5 family transposase [Sulfitobacter sp. W027]
MPKQPAFPGLRQSMKKKQTRREKFLAEMDAVVPWPRLVALIGPHYPRVGPKGGRPPMPLETMLRIYFLQNWYALSDPMAEEMLYDSEAMRQFAGIELGDDRIPDETTILNFRHLLEKHRLTEKLFVEVNKHLADQGITLRSGTLVDATIIDAPSSTKNEVKARDPEMSSTKKGNDWYFGMKAHVGVDAQSGIVHSLDTTTAKTHDSQVWDDLLHGEETSVWADKGYVSAAREAAFSGPGKFWGVMRKAAKGGKLHPIDDDINRIIAKVRARVEHPFRVIKRQFGYIKTRYRGLAKNRAQLFALFALGNLFLVRRKLMA